MQLAVQSTRSYNIFFPPFATHHLTIPVLGDLGLRRLPHGWPLDLPLGCRAGGG